MTRREFSKPVKGEMLRRASDAKGRIRCEGCGLDVTGKAIEFDHTIPEALVLDKSRALTAADGRLLGKACCHDPKTHKHDVPGIARAKRLEQTRVARAPSRNPLPGSKASGWKRKMNGTVERRT
jgi:hypothetical protein